MLATLIVGSELFDFFLFAVDIAIIVFAVDLVFVWIQTYFRNDSFLLRDLSFSDRNNLSLRTRLARFGTRLARFLIKLWDWNPITQERRSFTSIQTLYSRLPTATLTSASKRHLLLNLKLALGHVLVDLVFVTGYPFAPVPALDAVFAVLFPRLHHTLLVLFRFKEDCRLAQVKEWLVMVWWPGPWRMLSNSKHLHTFDFGHRSFFSWATVPLWTTFNTDITFLMVFWTTVIEVIIFTTGAVVQNLAFRRLPTWISSPDGWRPIIRCSLLWT